MTVARNTKRQLRLMRLLWSVGGFLLVSMPSVALAHENVGEDELAVANWMLIAAFVTIVLGAFMGLWAYKSGQFRNVEESKYNMLDTAEDFDSIMAESDTRETEREAAQVREAQGAHGAQGIKTATANTVAANASTVTKL